MKRLRKNLKIFKDLSEGTGFQVDVLEKVYRSAELLIETVGVGIGDGELVKFRFGTLYTLRRAEVLPELYLTDPTLQKEWRDIQQRRENLRPYVDGWDKDDFGNYEAEIEFEENS